jgi:hypothetical protein
MASEPIPQRVEVSFVGPTPAGQIARASGVTDVEVSGQTVRCLVYGSFQPFLDALRGYEVISLTSSVATDRATEPGAPGPEAAGDGGGGGEAIEL